MAMSNDMNIVIRAIVNKDLLFLVFIALNYFPEIFLEYDMINIS